MAPIDVLSSTSTIISITNIISVISIKLLVLVLLFIFRARTKVVLVKVVSQMIYYFPEYYIICIHIPLVSLHTYRSVHEDNRLFRKPP